MSVKQFRLIGPIPWVKEAKAHRPGSQIHHLDAASIVEWLARRLGPVRRRRSQILGMSRPGCAPFVKEGPRPRWLLLGMIYPAEPTGQAGWLQDLLAFGAGILLGVGFRICVACGIRKGIVFGMDRGH